LVTARWSFIKATILSPGAKRDLDRRSISESPEISPDVEEQIAISKPPGLGHHPKSAAHQLSEANHDTRPQFALHDYGHFPKPPKNGQRGIPSGYDQRR
jgi:hypothetical protein